MIQLAHALNHIHCRLIIHRDVKSQNVFITKNGIIKLGDFGIAKVMNYSKDIAKTFIGTPSYLSP